MLGAQLIDGKAIAADIRRELKEEVNQLRAENVIPGLTVVLVGDDPASLTYVRSKERASAEVGIRSEIKKLPKDTPQPKLIALIDLRVTSQQEAERMEKLILALQPELQGAEIHLSGGINRPPMERTTGNIQLYQKAKALAHSLGLSLPEDSSGGGSDGNFTSALGIPTLDGMGAVGYGPHATNEHILLTSTFERIALLTELFLHL
jgi:acetylornithine deacetylase/succinyl-diaminopimelate desuccinylase-like protein